MRSILRLLSFLKPYRWQAIAASALLLGMVIADLLIPRLTQRIIDQGIANKDMNVIWQTALIMLGAAFISALFAIANNILSVKTAQSFAADLRSALVRKVQTFSFSNLDQIRTGELITRSTSDIQMVQTIVMLALRTLTRAPIWMVGAVVMLILTSKRLSLMMAAFVPVIVVFIWVFARKARPLFLWVQKKLDRLNTVLQENLAGVRVVKAFVRQEHEIKRFEAANKDLTRSTIQVMRLVALLGPMMTLILNFGVAGAVWFGGTATLAGELTVGKVVASINYLMFALFPLLMAAGMLAPIAAADASASRILEVLDTKPKVRQKPDAKELTGARGRIEFRDVYFSYSDDQSAPVLSGVSFVAEAGETIAILGETGSGKSTLIHLIPRFYDVTAGQVSFDGIDVRDLKINSLRENIGIALQEAVLFSGTIRDNICYGRPDATDEEVVAAAKAAQAAEFIDLLPDGYQTVIGQRGVNLSGGQRQRLAIARALVMKPKVLILDDSTSAVDIETEVRLQDALDRLIAESAHTTTRLIVAQRISTVLLSDKIIVLDKGKIAAIGTHDRLIAESAIYQDIYRSQLGEHKEGSHA
jgi:ATP-binding cassette subfamily B protein